MNRPTQLAPRTSQRPLPRYSHVDLWRPYYHKYPPQHGELSSLIPSPCPLKHSLFIFSLLPCWPKHRQRALPFQTNTARLGFLTGIQGVPPPIGGPRTAPGPDEAHNQAGPRPWAHQYSLSPPLPPPLNFLHSVSIQLKQHIGTLFYLKNNWDRSLHDRFHLYWTFGGLMRTRRGAQKIIQQMRFVVGT